VLLGTQQRPEHLELLIGKPNDPHRASGRWKVRVGAAG
jgi:hypothetical protein